MMSTLVFSTKFLPFEAETLKLLSTKYFYLQVLIFLCDNTFFAKIKTVLSNWF